MNYQSSFTLSPLPGATGSWHVEMALMPEPIAPMWYRMTDSTGVLHGNHLNPQITGLTYTNKLDNWKQLCERWRLAYASVTVYQDGPDLANQGVLTVCQLPVKGVLHYTSKTDIVTRVVNARIPLIQYQDTDIPNFDVSQSMPNAYFGRSREGAYVPLKLTETCQDWKSYADCTYLSATTTPTCAATEIVGTGMPLATFPVLCQSQSENAGNVTWVNGTPLLPMANENWGHICAKNMAVTTSLSFFVRMGWEMQVQPSSTISPQLMLSPAYDGPALDAYFAIAREMKDAYPADFNDLGKIWDTISGIAQTIAPVLSAIHPALGGGISAGVSAGNAIRKYFSQSASASSMAQRESVKSMLAKFGPKIQAIARSDAQEAAAVAAAAKPKPKPKTRSRTRQRAQRRIGAAGRK
jgi:hypothetical protein